MNKLNLENTENSLKVNELRLMQQYYVNLWGVIIIEKEN